MKVKDVLTYLENRFPYELASDFDNGKIGLAVGSPNYEVNGILCSLDVSLEVINDAISKNCNLIITHHPLLFSPITKVIKEEEKGNIIYELIKNDISLISMHTNMDLGIGGVADSIAQAFDLKNSNIYSSTPNDFIRIGEIEETTLKDLILKTKSIFKLDGVRYVGSLNKKIKKIAILGGSGGSESEIREAINANCDCYITGELKHHLGLYAHYYDIALIEMNHGIEQIVFKNLINDLKEKFKNINILYTEFNTDLYKMM